MTYQNPTDIGNRALQLLGLPHIGSFGDLSLGAVEVSLAYDKIREAELQRNMWTFSTRRCILRPLSTSSAAITFPAYNAATTYHGGAVVTYNGLLWYSLIDNNIGNTPGTFPATGPLKWDYYFGTTVAQPWDEGQAAGTSQNVGYSSGEIVYKTPGDGTYTIYRSVVQNNTNQPDAVDLWTSNIMYNSGDVVKFNGTNYQALVGLNIGHEPDTSATQWTTTVTNPTVSRSWISLGTTGLSTLPIIYPLTTGPVESTLTRNAFPKPANYLKSCPPAPKEGQITWLGGPSGVEELDLDFEGDYIVSDTVNPMMVRFVANITDVTKFHPMFNEGLAAAVALACAPSLRDKDGNAIGTTRARRAYTDAIKDARTQNAIEMGPITLPDDEWISVRY